MRKDRDINLVTTEQRINYLKSEPNNHATKIFTENLLTREMKKKKKIEIFINTSLFKALNTRCKWNINVWVLLWFVKLK